MPFLMDAIDAGGTRRKLEDITAGGLRAFDEVQERSAQIDEEFKQAKAKYDAEAAAMDQLVADAKAAQQAKPEPEDEARTGAWQRRDAKPTIHAFGGEEFTEEPRTEPTGIRVPPLEAPPAPAPPAPPAPPAGADPVRELAFGYDDPEETGAVAIPPAATRRPAPQPGPGDDDDLSGHSWMR